ncbi:bifunctional phosphopantothenoylcysteine decarboxylase/phosphopantothenate--cysteine ligase CoaBC, partial [Candidatus Sumerlaeota bacterium]|nr:bifunctional phosphopantothenoylcysteine decarboxylase/phosphopantothenate--cysteine ligase CoaBC [Candidatus Sumerlaeota bacterium]
MTLADKKIALLISGGIAAYKAADLASRLRKAGAEVRVAMTRAAREFIAPLTFEAITGHPVYCEVFGQPDSHRMEHIELARWADAAIVAPASADFIARMAHGLADDAPLTLLLAFRGPVWIAPAMNTAMWEHPATQANLKILGGRGISVIGPGSGPLACGEVGEGRMAEPADCAAALESGLGGNLGKPLAGKTVLITAGPTRESLDPIRFISNRSTGRMGTALAAAASKVGARVLLVHGPLSVSIPPGVESVPAESAAEMLAAVQERFSGCHVAIFSAAVANYASAEKSGKKIKGGKTLTLELTRTPDIAAWAGEHRNGKQFLAGFAAESENLIEAAKEKLKAKKMDVIIANQIGVPGIAFEATDN